MDTIRLKQFCVLAETESLSKAADLLFITHSGLHKSIKVLESQLGFKITTSKGRGITLTDKAREFYPKARQILQLIDEALTYNSKKELQCLRIGSLEVFIPKLANTILQDNYFKDHSIELHDFIPGELEHSVLNNIVDYGLTYIPVPTTGIQFLKVTDFKMVIICTNKNYQNMKFSEVPFVTPYSPLIRNPANIKNRDGWSSPNHERLEKYKTNSLFAALQIVMNKQAAIYAPDFLTHFFNSKTYNIFTEIKEVNVKRNLYLVMREQSEESIVAKKIARIVRTMIK